MESILQEVDVNHITSRIIRCGFRVSNAMGPGFLEKVYENALAFELRDCGLDVLQQAHVEVRYREQVVGEYQPDLLVASRVVVEVKAIRSLEAIHESQAINYLKCTKLKVALLMNFARPRLEWRRLVLDL
jgi:GxxExxY protein